MRLRKTILTALLALSAAACASGTTPGGNAGGPSGAGPSGTATSSAMPPDVQGVAVHHRGSAQFELDLPTGRRVYVDVEDQLGLERQPTAQDLLLITNMAPHHYSDTFADAFPGQKLIESSGRIDVEGLRITGIDSSTTQQPVDHQYPGNEMFLIEAADLRILVCGELDQVRFDDEQMAALGRVDVALCPINYVGAGPDNSGKLSLDLIDQMKPRLVIPTHGASMPSAQAAAERWPATFSTRERLLFTPESLPVKTTVLYVGDQAASYGTILNLTENTTW